jgi:hypothetical protein
VSWACPCSQIRGVDLQIHEIFPGVSSILGRISGLASLLDPTSSFVVELPPSAAIQQLRLLLFRTWLSLPLEGRLADLRKYAAECLGSHQILTREWLDGIRSIQLVPAGADHAERDLFAADMEALMALLRSRSR